MGDYKFLKILDNTFLFNVVEDPLERGNLKERHKDVYDRIVAEWQRGTRRCCRKSPRASPARSPGEESPTTTARNKQAGRPIQPSLCPRPRSRGDCHILLDPFGRGS